MKNMIEREAIEKKIYIIRGQKVMLDKDLAELYGVPTKRLNEQVRRNRKRFPSDFMFRLSSREFGNLKSQFATSSWGGTRKLPYVFTEQNIAMLSSVLNSDRAIRVNITIMRIFVGLRDLLMSHTELRKRLNELEKKYDAQFKIVFDAIKQLMIPPEKSRRRMGFYKE